MKSKLHASFFYFLCCSFGGCFASVLLGAYLSYFSESLKKLKIFFVISLFICVFYNLFFYWVAFQSLAAPFVFRQFLSDPIPVTASSLLGIAYGLGLLICHQRVYKKDFLKPLASSAAPLIIIAGIGGLINLLLIFSLYLVLLP